MKKYIPIVIGILIASTGFVFARELVQVSTQVVYETFKTSITKIVDGDNTCYFAEGATGVALSCLK